MRTQRAVAAACLVFFGSAATAYADIPSAATFTSAAETLCQDGDDCINNFTTTPTGTFGGTLAITTNRVSGERSSVKFTTRVDNTFVLPRRTVTSQYEGIYQLEGTLSVSGANASGYCVASYPGQNYTHVTTFRTVDTDPTTLTPSAWAFDEETQDWVVEESFTATKRYLPKEFPVYIELSCGLEAGPAPCIELSCGLEAGPESRAEFKLENTSRLDHLHHLTTG